MMIELKRGISLDPSKVIAVEEIDDSSVRILFDGSEITVDVSYRHVLSIIKSMRSFNTTQIP